jgi:hypothetical protein
MRQELAVIKGKMLDVTVEKQATEQQLEQAKRLIRQLQADVERLHATKLATAKQLAVACEETIPAAAPTIFFRRLTDPPPPPGHMGRETVMWAAEYWEPSGLVHFGRGFPTAVAWIKEYLNGHPQGQFVDAGVELVLVEDGARRDGIGTKLIRACRDKWSRLLITPSPNPGPGERFVKAVRQRVAGVLDQGDMRRLLFPEEK